MMGSIWTVAFWKGAAERLFWAFVASFGGMLLADGFNWMETSWRHMLVAAAIAAVISLVKSMGVNASGMGPVGSASAVYDRPRDYGHAASDGS